MRVTHTKLVRDRIPEIIKAAGEHPITRVLDDADYRGALLAKLTEETQEARRASPDQLAGELADVLEVLQAIANTHGLSWDQVLKVATVKRTDRGSFDDCIFLESVETPG